MSDIFTPPSAAEIAFYSAANGVAICDDRDGGLAWPACGATIAEHALQPLDALAGFVRLYPGAPAEALYRFAAGQGIHGEAADGFEALAPKHRLAYAIFGAALPAIDAIFAGELARMQAVVQAAAEPPLAAALAGPIEDTILAPPVGPLDVVGHTVVTTIDAGAAAEPAMTAFETEPDGAGAETEPDSAGVETVAGAEPSEPAPEPDPAPEAEPDPVMKPAAASRRKS